MIYAVVSFAFPDYHRDSVQALGRPYYDQHGNGPVYFVSFPGTKAQLVEALRLVGDVSIDHAVVSLVRPHQYLDFDGLPEWMERHGIQPDPTTATTT